MKKFFAMVAVVAMLATFSAATAGYGRGNRGCNQTGNTTQCTAMQQGKGAGQGCRKAACQPGADCVNPQCPYYVAQENS